MRIDSIYLRDVGPFDEVTIPFPEGSDPKLADVYLLTGPNGCGKSTVLYAIAAAVSGGIGRLGEDRLSPRFRSQRAMAAVKAGSDALLATSFLSVDPENPYEGTRTTPAMTLYGGHTAVLTPKSRFDWAAFAYAGSRSMQDARVVAIQELTDNPFENSLGFDRATDTSKLVHWIASQYLKELKAEKNGDLERAARLKRSVDDIALVISQITGDTFAFDQSVNDNDVRVKRNGLVTELGVLPDGLKSIVSWVADLLMRLDRVPWVDEIPPMERSFLLLLDEIDIHLHPEWQRKVLPVVQRLFPNAQIIASTHSPFVVASAADAHVITFAVKDGVSTLKSIETSQIGTSVSAIVHGIFGITSEFDVDTEDLFVRFQAAKSRLLSGGSTDRAEVDELARTIAARSEEARQLIGFELRQLDRHLAKRAG